MKSTVKRLLQPVRKTRKTLSVSLDSSQMEMIDKLTMFFSQKSGQHLSRNQLIEHAVDSFIDESVDVIQQQFAVNIRITTLSELERDKNAGTTDVSHLDTVIVPARDNDEYREAFFQRNRWGNVRISEEKLRYMHYMAVYVGAPTSGITHYAKIIAYHPDTDNPGRFVILVSDPLPLSHVVEADDSSAAAGMRSCRYTALALLQQARTLHELFDTGVERIAK